MDSMETPTPKPMPPQKPAELALPPELLAAQEQMAKVQCAFCRKMVDKGDKFCRYCGKEVGKVPFRFTHAGAAGMFLVIGPLNLFWIWRSPVMSRNTKIFYTFFYLSLTVMVLIPVVKSLKAIIDLYSGALSGNL